MRHHNPGNVFLDLDKPLEVRNATGVHKDDKTEAPLFIPIVATDDVFLRQRVVQEGGCVMTFHQLWLLLVDIAR